MRFINSLALTIKTCLFLFIFSTACADSALLLGGPLTLSESEKKQSLEEATLTDYVREDTLPGDPEYAELRADIGTVYLNSDPYVQQYEDFLPQNRYIEKTGEAGNYIRFDNLRFWTEWGVNESIHKPTWSSALVDTSKVKKAYILVNRFVEKIGEMDLRVGHAQVLFEFEDGGVLTDYGQVGGIYFSYEAMLKKGQVFSAIKSGLSQTYEGTIVVGTRNDIFHKTEVSAGVDLIELDLNQEQLKSHLENAFATALDKRYLKTNKYNLFAHQCITVQFEILTKALGKRIHEWYPSSVYVTLEDAGLIESYEYLEAPSEVWQYALKHFSDDAQIEMNPTDLVMRPAIESADGPRNPFLGITF